MTELKNLEKEVALRKETLVKYQNEYKEKLKELEDCKALNMRFQIKVSDHALIRYMERVMGVDIPAIKDGLIEAELAKLIAMARGEGKVKYMGKTYALKNYTIKTIINDEQV